MDNANIEALLETCTMQAIEYKARKWLLAVQRGALTADYAASEIAGDITYQGASPDRYEAIKAYALSCFE